MPPLHVHQGTKAIPLDDSLMTPGSWGTSEETRLPRTKQHPQRFFPVSDCRKVPALSSAPYIHACHVPVLFHLLVFQFSFFLLCLSVCPGWFVSLCLCRACSPCLCLSLPLPWLSSFSVCHFSLFSSWLWLSSVAVRASLTSAESQRKAVLELRGDFLLLFGS